MLTVFTLAGAVEVSTTVVTAVSVVVCGGGVTVFCGIIVVLTKAVSGMLMVRVELGTFPTELLPSFV